MTIKEILALHDRGEIQLTTMEAAAFRQMPSGMAVIGFTVAKQKRNETELAKLRKPS